MDEEKIVTLDGSIPTLDASELSYEFEKARIKGVNPDDLIDEYYKTEGKIMPPTFEYVSSFRDPVTGTSAVDKALTVFSSLGDVPFGFLLSSDEIRATYNEYDVNYGSVVEAVDSHCTSAITNANKVATSFVDLEKKIKSGIEQIVQKDTELQGLIAHG